MLRIPSTSSDATKKIMPSKTKNFTCRITLLAKAAWITFFTLFTVPVMSNLLSLDLEYGDMDMIITAVVLLLVFSSLSIGLLLRHEADPGITQRDKLMLVSFSFVLVVVSYFPVLFTGIIDGGYGWVMGIILASIVSFGEFGCLNACCKHRTGIATQQVDDMSM